MEVDHSGGESDMDKDEEMVSVIVDSGADAWPFLGYLMKGIPTKGTSPYLQDA